MDYEKKYEKLVDAVKVLRDNNPSDEGIQNWVNDNVSELKESYDEKIRKVLVELVKCNERCGYFMINNITTSAMLAWLEKQGKQNDSDVKDYNNIDPHFGKPIDKVEPKFQNGKWIVWQNKCYKVNYNGCGYELIDQNDLKTSLEYGTVDENAHLWTIQDAKDGDVLFYRGNVKYSDGIKYERICIFNNLDNAFFTLTKASNYIEEYDIDVNIDYPDNTVPATKEQKEILFMAMTDAGYTFDFEKKELKKIEHNPTEWSEEDEKMCQETIDWFEKKCFPYALENDNTARESIKWLKSLKDRYTWKPSDEQMVVLELACKYERVFTPKQIDILIGLKEQLKKLKGE